MGISTFDGGKGYKLVMELSSGMIPSVAGHQRIDRRSLELHRAIAEKIRAHPDLIQIAHQNLERWSKTNGRSQPYWDAWRALLNQPLADLLALMIEPGERMTSLRQATPFAGVLTPAERWAVYERHERANATPL